MRTRRFVTAAIAAASFALVSPLVSPLVAQNPIGGAVPLPTAPRVANQSDTVLDAFKKPPLSPRRAFLTSLLLPGYAQSRLNRPTASILFAAVEVAAIGMARKSAQDVREAERAPKDSIVASYTFDPVTGIATPSSYTQPRFTPGRVRARHLHYEDWIAVIAFNHIIAAADAYVAANLWDFKANVSMNAATRSATLTASRSF
jgi:hypothetical protein